MKWIIPVAASVLIAGCGIKPVQIKTADGSARYYMDCGDDKAACIVKANELCPSGYEMLNESDTNQVSVGPWGGGSYRQVSVEVECN